MPEAYMEKDQSEMAVSTAAEDKVSSKLNPIIETKGFFIWLKIVTGAGSVRCPLNPSF